MEEESRKYFKWSSFILDLRVEVITNTHCTNNGGNKEECQNKVQQREKFTAWF